MSSRKSKSVANWADSFDVSSIRPKSETLAYQQELRDAIKEFLELKVAGRTTAPLSRFRKEFLVPNFGYTLSSQSLMRYVKTHEKELWEKIRDNEQGK